MKHKMTSLDHRSRNERDVPMLMKIADEATMRLDEERGDSDVDPGPLRASYLAIRDRRAKEDAGEQLP